MTRRVLTAEQMTTILAVIRSVDDRQALLPSVLATVHNALLQEGGRLLADVRSGPRLSPRVWQIPTAQRDAIVDAASDRADRWDAGGRLRSELLSRMPSCFDDPTASTGTPPPDGGWRLLCVSVRGDECYLVGNPNVHPVGLVPAGVGTVFTHLDQIKAYVRRQLRGATACWQVRVVDQAGTVVHYGFRAGYNGTGETWTWRTA